MNKYYCENQLITDNCVSNVVYINSGENIISINMQVTENFDSIDILNVYFQVSQDEDFSNHTELVKQTFFKEHLIKGMTTQIKFVPKNFLKYSRLYFEIIGEKPTTGEITAFLYQEEKKMNNCKRIRQMSIKEMAETIANFAVICVFESLKKIFGGLLYNHLNNETKQEYKNSITKITQEWLEAESEE